MGRQRELGEIQSLCAASRLVSLVGPAGIGKTRLAAAIASDLAQDHQVQWVTAGVADPVACVNRLVAAIRDQRNLVVLDGCVGDPESVAAIADLMRRSPRARLLVTGGHPLGFDDEAVWATPGLTIGPDGPVAQGGAVGPEAPEAVRLFLARYRSPGRTAHTPSAHTHSAGADLGTALGADAISVVARICRLLSGMPLAIELVASACRPADLAEAAALPAALGVTADEPLPDPVGAALAFAHARLSEREQVLLRRLSVFSSSFDLTAACAVGGTAAPLDPASVRSVLTLLSAASMVQLIREPGRQRLGLLGPIRRYAADRLATSGESDAARWSHLRHYGGLAAAVNPAVAPARPLADADLDLLDAEFDNFRTAFETVRLLGATTDTTGLRLAVALRPLCLFRGHYAIGVEWLRTALAAAVDPPPGLLATATAGLGNLSMLLCEYPEAVRYLERANELYRALPDAAGEAATLLSLGGVAREQGRYDDATALYERALGLARALDDRPLAARIENYRAFVAWLTGDDELAAELSRRSLTLFRDQQESEGVAWALLSLGVVARHQGDAVRATELFEACLSLSDWTGYAEGVAWSREQLGMLALDHHDLSTAEQLLSAAIDAHRAIGDRWRTSSTLDNLAAVAVRRGDGERAALLLGAADAIRREIDVPVPQCERPARQRTEQASAELLGIERFTVLRQLGAGAELTDVLTDALTDVPADHPGNPAMPEAASRSDQVTPAQH